MKDERDPKSPVPFTRDPGTGRPVIGFMSGNQQNPEMICEVFVLSPTDLLEPHELAAATAADKLA